MFNSHELLQRSSSDIVVQGRRHYVLDADMAVYMACESLKVKNNKLQAEKELLEAQVKHLLKQNQLLLNEHSLMTKSEDWKCIPWGQNPQDISVNFCAREFIDNPRRASSDSPLNRRHFSSSAACHTDMQSSHQSRVVDSGDTERYYALRSSELGMLFARDVRGDVTSSAGQRVYAQESLGESNKLEPPVIKETVVVKPSREVCLAQPVYPPLGDMNTGGGEIRTRRSGSAEDVQEWRGGREKPGALDVVFADDLHSLKQDGLVSFLMKELHDALTCIEDQKDQLSHLQQIVSQQQQTQIIPNHRQSNHPCSRCGYVPTTTNVNLEDSNLTVGSGSIIVETPLLSVDFDDKVGVQCTSNPERRPLEVASSSHDIETTRKVLHHHDLSHFLQRNDRSPVLTNIPSEVLERVIISREPPNARMFSPNTIRKSLEAGISEVVLTGLDESMDQSCDSVPSYRPPPLVGVHEGSANHRHCEHSFLNSDSLPSNSYTSSTNLRVCPLCDISFRSDCDQPQFEQHVHGHFLDNHIINEYELV